SRRHASLSPAIIRVDSGCIFLISIATGFRLPASIATNTGHPVAARTVNPVLSPSTMAIIDQSSPSSLIRCHAPFLTVPRWNHRGTVKKGAWHLISDDGDDWSMIAMVEGLSTGLTVRAATGWPVFVAIDAGNLKPVAIEIKKMHPESTLIIAGDNDAWRR